MRCKYCMDGRHQYCLDGEAAREDMESLYDGPPPWYGCDCPCEGGTLEYHIPYSPGPGEED